MLKRYKFVPQKNDQSSNIYLNLIISAVLLLANFENNNLTIRIRIFILKLRNNQYLHSFHKKEFAPFKFSSPRLDLDTPGRISKNFPPFLVGRWRILAEEHARSKKWFAKKKKKEKRKRICRCNACSDRVIKCARTFDARRARETSRDARGSIKNAVITFRQRLWNLRWSLLFLLFESRPSRFISVPYRSIGWRSVDARFRRLRRLFFAIGIEFARTLEDRRRVGVLYSEILLLSDFIGRFFLHG